MLKLCRKVINSLQLDELLGGLQKCQRSNLLLFVLLPGYFYFTLNSHKKFISFSNQTEHTGHLQITDSTDIINVYNSYLKHVSVL